MVKVGVLEFSRLRRTLNRGLRFFVLKFTDLKKNVEILKVVVRWTYPRLNASLSWWISVISLSYIILQFIFPYPWKEKLNLIDDRNELFQRLSWNCIKYNSLTITFQSWKTALSFRLIVLLCKINSRVIETWRKNGRSSPLTWTDKIKDYQLKGKGLKQLVKKSQLLGLCSATYLVNI